MDAAHYGEVDYTIVGDSHTEWMNQGCHLVDNLQQST